MKTSKMLSIFIAFLAIVGIGAIAMTFLLNYNSFSPQMPMIIDDGKNIFITTSANEHYEKYRFKFISGLDKIIIDSPSNVLTEEVLEEYNVQIGKTYYVSTCYLGEFEGENSEWSKDLTWTRQAYLDKPVVTNIEGENKIAWEPIARADYYVVSIKTRESVLNKEVTDCFYDYSDLNGGNLEFKVTACSNSQAYRSNASLQSITVEHTYKLKPLVSGRIQNKILYIGSQDKLDHVQVYINGSPYIVKTSNQTIIDGNYHYSASLKSIYVDGGIYSMSPYSIEEFEIYNGPLFTIADII